MKIARTAFAITAAAVGVGTGLGGCASTSDVDVDNARVSYAEVRRAIAVAEREPERLRLIDARLPSDFAAGTLPGAVNMQPVEIRRGAGPDPRLDRFGQKIVFGENPASPSARSLVKRMIEEGYDDVAFYAGGWQEWVRLGAPAAEPASASR